METEKSFGERWVHFDLKGAPPKLSYLKAMLPFLKACGATGILIEFEDMFPYTGELKVLRNEDAYPEDELKDFLTIVKSEDLDVVPLIQTFGHLEFLLKHESFCHLREMSDYPNAICPSFEDSQRIILMMVDQVQEFFPNPRYFHIGCDEVCYIGLCKACKEKNKSAHDLFIDHVKFVAGHLHRKYDLRCIIWDDILRGINAAKLKDSGLPELVDVMAWEYQDVQKINQGHLTMLESVFPGVWFASAFKGATTPCQTVTPTGFHAENHFQWLNVLREFPSSPKGICLTGWSRFDHYAALCDLLPVALPTLAICLSMTTTGCFTKDMHETLSTEMGFSTLIPWHPLDKDFDTDCALKFPGWQIYQGLHLLIRLDRESDGLINGDLRRSWLSKRHVRKAQTSPAIAEQLLEVARRYIERYRLLEIGLRTCMSDVFFDSTVEEWLETHFYPRRDELQDLVIDAGHLVAIGASVINM